MTPKLTQLMLCVPLFVCMQASAQEKYSKVTIAMSQPGTQRFLLEQLHADHFELQNDSAVIVLNSAELDRLQHSGYAYRIITDDVVQHTIELNRGITVGENRAAFQGHGCVSLAGLIPVPASFGTGGSLRLGAAAGNPGYFTYAEMITAMQALQSNFPSLISVFSIGNSANGNPIYAVKISDNVAVDETEPEILYTGLQHAREAIGGTSLIFFMQFLLSQYAADDRVQALVNNRAIYIVPCVNPDGYMYNYSGASASYPVTGGGLWRKNRRHTGGVAGNIGVDLNRNYGIDWGNCSGATSSCGSNVKTDDTYYGPNAFSEPETQAIRNFVQSRRFVNAIDQHCYGPYYSLPYGRPSLHPPLNTADAAYYTRIPALMGLYNGHRAGNSPQTVNYEVAGGIKDWLLMGDIGSGTGPKGKIYGMTGEAGGGDFWAPVSQIIPLCRELCFQNLQLAYAAGSYIELEDLNDIAITCASATFKFQLRNIGLLNSPVTVSVVPIENIQSVGMPVTVTLSNYNDTYTDSIAYALSPNFVSGQRIKFAWKIETAGITLYDTIVKYFNPLSLLSDDMEGSFSANWTATISPPGPAGWAFTSLDAYHGSKSMTESPSGNYTSNSVRTVTYRNNLNLADAQSAYLSFWVKHSAENFHDKLQVQVSVDGSSWAALCGIHTVKENNITNGGTLGGQPALTGIRENWTHELFDLEDYKGNASVQFRFQFSSDNDAGSFAFEKDDGFYIDNLSIIKVVNISTLPVKFENFTAQLSQNNQVQLNWEAYTDQRHDYFVAERLISNGAGFEQIATIYGQAPYMAVDPFPAEGNNYYRIKQVDKNGHVTYSNVINIRYEANYFSTLVYPNPAHEMLGIRITGMSFREPLRIRITDMWGRTVLDQTMLAGSGTAHLKVDISKLPAQTYIIKVSNHRRLVLMRDRFVKQ